VTRKSIVPALLLSFLVAQAVAGQDARHPVAPDRATILDVARQVMHDARYCALVTLGNDGQPQARVVDPFLPDDGMTVWIGTNPITRKVAQIRKDARVTLFYFDGESLSYVTILGRAELVDDPTEKAKHWKEEWAPLYTDGSRGEDYLLIRVRPRRIEVVSYGGGVPNDPVTWRPAAVDFP